MDSTRSRKGRSRPNQSACGTKNDHLMDDSLFSQNLNLIISSLKSLSIDDQKDFKRISTLLDTLFSTLDLRIKSNPDDKHNQHEQLKDFTQELMLLNQFLLRIKEMLNNVDHLNQDVFEIQHLVLKNFNLLLKITKNLESPVYCDILENMIDHLIQHKIVICRETKKTTDQQANDNMVTLNSTCLLLIKCIYFISSKCTIQYDHRRKNNISGKFIGILRCFCFYGLKKYDLNLFPVNIYPSPLSQFMSKELQNEINTKKNRTRNKINEDEIFDDGYSTNLLSSPNFSASEYSSSELDESFSSLELAAKREFQNKKIYVKIRMFAYECLQALLIVFDIRTVFGFWSCLFPDSISPIPNDTHFSILTTISSDTSHRVRASAVNFMYHFLDDGKQFIQVLVQDSSDRHRPSSSTSSFTPLSVSFTMMIKELHTFFQYILFKETNSSMLILIYKLLSLIVSITPYQKLNHDILHPLFYQNSFLLDNKVTQIKNVSLGLYVKIFSLQTIPKELETWIFENKHGRETINKVFKHCEEFIESQDYILLMIESIKLFTSILKHHSLALKFLQMDSGNNFKIDHICQTAVRIIEMEKCFNNSVLQNLMCKFIHSIGLFLKELSSHEQSDGEVKLFVDHQHKIQFTKEWYLKVFQTKLFQQALVKQDLSTVQHSCQITLINVCSLIPDETFASFDEKIRFNIISILISLAKIDETIDDYETHSEEETDQTIYTKSTSIRCLSIFQSFQCCAEDLDLICDLIDICLNVFRDVESLKKIPKKKQIYFVEHTLWSLANICDSIKKTQLHLKIDESFLIKIAITLQNLFTGIPHHTDDILINLVRNAGIVIFLILDQQQQSSIQNEIVDCESIISELNRTPRRLDPKIILDIVGHLIDIMSKKKSYKLHWNICIGFSYLFKLENFVELTTKSNYLEKIFFILYQTFMTTANHKVQSYSIFTISSITRLECFQEHLKQLWFSIVEKFINNWTTVPVHSKRSWMEKFSFAIERFYKEFVKDNFNSEDDVKKCLKMLTEFLENESNIKQPDPELDCKLNQLCRLMIQ